MVKIKSTQIMTSKAEFSVTCINWQIALFASTRQRIKAWPRPSPLWDKHCVHSNVFLMPDRHEKGEQHCNN